MRAWLFLLSGLIVWAVHFFALYVAASLFPGLMLANFLSIALTLAALAAAGLLLWRATRMLSADKRKELTGWLAGLTAAGNAIALVAIAYQALPALLPLLQT